MASADSWPIEPPSSRWDFPDPEIARDQDYLGEGADLEPGTLLAAYRQGIFPMPMRRGGPPAWWSPARRGVLPLDNLRISKSLRQSAKRFEIRIDAAVDEVLRACANPRRPGGWITDDIIKAYERLHELGWMHTVETWSSDGKLVGGLYGVTIGGLFAGESMFHRERDASKVALVALVDILRNDGGPDGRIPTPQNRSASSAIWQGPRVLDVQWRTSHLASLGAVEVMRTDYLRMLRQALRGPMPSVFGDAAWRAGGDGDSNLGSAPGSGPGSNAGSRPGPGHDSNADSYGGTGATSPVSDASEGTARLEPGDPSSADSAR